MLEKKRQRTEEGRRKNACKQSRTEQYEANTQNYDTIQFSKYFHHLKITKITLEQNEKSAFSLAIYLLVYRIDFALFIVHILAWILLYTSASN